MTMEVTVVHVHNYRNHRTCTLNFVQTGHVTLMPISQFSIIADVLHGANLWRFEQVLRYALDYGDYEQAAEWLADHLVITIDERVIGNTEYLEAVAA